jgi:tRNAThr (cytosine32-N3)-methyltransferase
VGDAAIPLSEANPTAVVHACDYSATAIDVLRRNPACTSGRIHAFVADAQQCLTGGVPAGSVDVVTCIFALSANSAEGVAKVGPCRISRALP